MDKGRWTIIACALRTRWANTGGDPSTKRPRRDPQTLAMVQGATRHFEQTPAEGGQPFYAAVSQSESPLFESRIFIVTLVPVYEIKGLLYCRSFSKYRSLAESGNLHVTFGVRGAHAKSSRLASETTTFPGSARRCAPVSLPTTNQFPLLRLLPYLRLFPI